MTRDAKTPEPSRSPRWRARAYARARRVHRRLLRKRAGVHSVTFGGAWFLVGAPVNRRQAKAAHPMHAARRVRDIARRMAHLGLAEQVGSMPLVMPAEPTTEAPAAEAPEPPPLESADLLGAVTLHGPTSTSAKACQTGATSRAHAA